jgi:hypothetical protein
MCNDNIPSPVVRMASKSAMPSEKHGWHPRARCHPKSKNGIQERDAIRKARMASKSTMPSEKHGWHPRARCHLFILPRSFSLHLQKANQYFQYPLPGYYKNKLRMRDLRFQIRKYSSPRAVFRF